MREAIEQALREALRDAGARPAFYRLLMEVDIYAVTANTEDELRSGGRGQLKLVMYESNGMEVVPFFTSAAKLESTLKDRPGWVRLRAKDFLRMVRRAHSVLNPGHAEQWTFCPAEVDAIIDGPMIPTSVLDPTEWSLEPAPGAPLPEAVIAGLKSFYARQSGVRAAYLLGARSRIPGPADRNLVVVDLDDPEAMREVSEGTRLVVDHLDGVTSDLFHLVVLVAGISSPIRKYVESLAPTPFVVRRESSHGAAS